jgi:hypothetical protein
MVSAMRIKDAVRMLIAVGAFGCASLLIVGLTPLTSDAASVSPIHAVSIAETPSGTCFWVAFTNGAVESYGQAPSFGGITPQLNEPIVQLVPTQDGQGYYLVAADGGVFTFGDAQFYGSMGGTKLNQPVTGMTLTSDGQGYWLVGRDGGVFSFGDAQYYGGTQDSGLNAVAISTASSAFAGYEITSSNSAFEGFSDGKGGGGNPLVTSLNAPIVSRSDGLTNGQGFWLLGSDGGVFTFGDAQFYGAAVGQVTGNDAVSITATPDGLGYLVLTTRDQIFAFGDAQTQYTAS